MTVSLEPVRRAAYRALCAHVSNESAEPLAATASRIDHWILLEYRGVWDRDVLGGSLLSPELKTHLRAQLRALGDARLLFVKKPERRSYGRRQLFFGKSTPGEERFFQLEFDRHDDLVELDFAAALSGRETPGLPVEHPLFVVCTHGKRDRCCAKYGRPLYDALRRETESAWVWQSTHVGGDRFAGNVVTMPDGVYYGGLDPERAVVVAEAHLAGHIELDAYRGRSAHPFVVQAAEHFLRGERGLTGMDAVRWTDREALDDDRWRITFATPDGGVAVDVRAGREDEPRQLTCRAQQLARPPRYELLALRPARASGQPSPGTRAADTA